MGSGVRENEKMETKQRTGNEVTDRAGVKVWFCSIFRFPVHPSPFPVSIISIENVIETLRYIHKIVMDILFSISFILS